MAALWLLAFAEVCLQLVAAAFVDVNLPAGTRLRADLVSGTTIQSATSAEGLVLQLTAGEAIRVLALELQGGSEFDVWGARLRVVVASTTRAAAQSGACRGHPAAVGEEVVDAPLSSLAGAPTLDSRGHAVLQTDLSAPIAFSQAGDFRLCYAYNGSFAPGHADLLDVLIRVFGVASDCVGRGCLAERPFRCYGRLLEGGLAGSCGVDLPGVHGGLAGAFSWSQAFVVSYGGDGLAMQLQAQSCGSAPDAGAFCTAGGPPCASTVPAAADARSVAFPPTVAFQAATEARTVAVCYCPGLWGCANDQDYSQQVGLMLLFVAHAAPAADAMCTTSLGGVLAPMAFVVCLRCPAGGCTFGEVGSRLRLAGGGGVSGTPTEEPSWSSSHSCRSSAPSVHVRPNTTEAMETDGGSRADFKRFQPPAPDDGGIPGFVLASWPEQEPPGSEVDVCVCLQDCDTMANWFKAGQIDVVAPQLAATASPFGGGTGYFVPGEVRRLGQLALDADLLAHGSPGPAILGLQSGGRLRLVAFDNAVASEGGTASAAAAAACASSAAVATSPVDLATLAGVALEGRLGFGGGGASGTQVAVLTAGTAAVCYCATGGTCSANAWAPVAQLVVAGPRPGQRWTLPTLRALRLEYFGTDLRATDVLRFVSESASCEAAPAAVDLCPPANVENGHALCASVKRYGEYSTEVLDQSHVGCDEQNVNCRQVLVEAVQSASSAGPLQLRFAGSLSTPSGLGDWGLTTDDVVVLGAGLACSGGGSGGCTREMLEHARGVLSFAGLQRYLRLDEGSGTTAADPVAGGVAVLSGTPAPAWVSGYSGSGSALRFTAAAQALSEAALERLDVARPWSLLLWMRLEGPLGRLALCGFADADGTFAEGEVEVGVAAVPEGAVFVRQAGSPGGGASEQVAHFPDANLNTTAGNWTHLALVYSGAVRGHLLLYVDGTLQEEVDGWRPMPAAFPLTGGGGIDTSKTRTTGALELDELRLYNVPLSPAQVAAVAAAADPGADQATPASQARGNAVRAAGGTDPRLFDLPGVAWEPMPHFALQGGNPIRWRRSNRAVTRAEIMSPGQQTVKVCWGRGGNFAEAGIATFEPPPLLRNVGLHFTAEEQLKTSPFVVTFTTADESSATGRRYVEAEGPMTLELVILSRSSLDVTSSTVDGAQLQLFPLSEDEFHEAKQSVCGQLFKELWSADDLKGFPMPRGCYYRMLPNTNDVRELVIVFEARNGLRGGQDYQLVLNGVATSSLFDPLKEMMLVVSGDDFHRARYTPLEQAPAYAVNHDFLTGAGQNDPQFAISGGLEVITYEEKNLFELVDTSRLMLRLRGPDSSNGAISRGCHLTLFLWPLTQWQLPLRCRDEADGWYTGLTGFRVQCSTYRGNFRRCGYVEQCSGGAVVVGGPQVNMIQVQMPPLMNDLFGTIVYQLEVSKMSMPPGGVMPTRLGAQIKKPDGTRPHYILSTGALIYARPSSGTVLGRLLTDGRDNVPFAGATAHLLYVLLVLPFSIRGPDTRMQPYYRPPSTIDVLAPQDFECLATSGVPAAGLGQMLVTPEGFAMAGLAEVSAEQPTGFGSLELSGWHAGPGRLCRYHVPEDSLVPAGSPLVVGATVRPTNTSLSIADPANLWTVNVSSPGDHNESQATLTFSASFYRTGPAGVPVLGDITRALIQPSDQAVSQPEGAGAVMNWLSVFFRLEQNISAGGGIDVEAPEAFDFGAQCTVQDLEAWQYAATGPPERGFPLPTVTGCSGTYKVSCQVPCLSEEEVRLRPNNVAKVVVEGPLMAGRIYSFAVMVTNPSRFNMTRFPAGRWALRSRDADGVAVDATRAAVPGTIMAGRASGPWQLRDGALPQLEVEDEAAWAAAASGASGGAGVSISSLLPHSSTGQLAEAVLAVALPQTCLCEVHITAPAGFAFGGLNGTNDTERFEARGIDPARTSFPAVLDTSVSMGNYLRFHPAAVNGSTRYHITVALLVPDFGPTTSAAAFFFEAVPSSATAGEGYAATLAAPPVRALLDGQVRPTTRLPDSPTYLLLSVRLVTPIASPGGLQLVLQRGYVVSAPCVAMPWPGEAAWASGSAFAHATCSTADGVLILRPASGRPFESGLLRFRLSGSSPPQEAAPSPAMALSAATTPCGARPCWSFVSSSQCGPASCDGAPLDAPQVLPAIEPAPALAQAYVLRFRPEGRDDRLGNSNVLAFAFRMAEPGAEDAPPDPLPAGSLELVGPPGFVFQERCTADVETRVVALFGSAAEALADWGVADWLDEGPVTDCGGTGEIARMWVKEVGLSPFKTYAFTVRVQNPASPPSTAAALNWTISFQGYFSRPFASPSLWTFTDAALTPLSTHAGPACYDDGTCVGAGVGVAVPVSIRVRPHSQVTTGGELHVMAPTDFGFSPTTPAVTDGQIVRGDRPTPCEVRQYVDANFSSAPEIWLFKDRDCVIADRGSTVDGSGTGDLRTLKLILRYERNEADPRPAKSLSPELGYEVIAYVDPPPGYRPARNWDLSSYNFVGQLLDTGFALGYEVSPVFRHFEHSNAGVNLVRSIYAPIVLDGLAPLPDFVLDMRLPETAWPADSLVLIGPPGFLLQRDPSAGPELGCADVLILEPPHAATDTSSNETEPVTCDGHRLTVSFARSRGSVQAGTLIRVHIAMANPEAPPSQDQNFWRAEHHSGVSGGLMAAAMAPSWSVIPRLRSPSMRLIGDRKAAGSHTTLSLSFVAVQAASEVLIEALSPRSFSFVLTDIFASAIIAGRPTAPQILGAGDDFCRLSLAMAALASVVVHTTNVKIPSTPGPSTWQVTTYSLLEDPLADAELRDKVQFDGFLVPDRVLVPGVSAVTDGIAAALVGKRQSMVTFRLQLPAVVVLPGDALLVEVEGGGAGGFELLPAAAELDGAQLQCAARVPASPQAQGANIRSLQLRLGARVEAGQSMQLRLTIVTPQDRAALQLESWRFAVLRPSATDVCNSTAAVLVATNDAGPVPLAVVTPLPTTPAPQPARLPPPLTAVAVEFELTPLDTGAAALIVSAPPGFNFPATAPCPAPGSPTLTCERVTVHGGRSSLRLACASGGTALTGAGLSVAASAGGAECMRGVPTMLWVQGPRITPPPEENIWLVEAVGATASEQLGRGELAGFELSNMPAEVSYAPMAGVPVSLAISFHSRVPIPAGGRVVVHRARALQQFSCGGDAVGQLRPLSLGLLSGCTETDDPPGVQLVLNGTLAAGHHVFTVPSMTPLSTPASAQDNLFEVHLMDAAGNELDVALDVPGEVVMHGIRITVWPAWWVQVGPSATTVDVAVPIEVLDDASVPVHGVLVRLPDRPTMAHLVTSEADLDVQAGGRAGLLLRPSPWLSVLDDRSFVLHLEPSSLLVTGLYVLRFGVTVPEASPAVDIWRVALCGAELLSEPAACAINGTAREGRGAAVQAVFALPGFDPRETPDREALLPSTVSAATAVVPHGEALWQRSAPFVLSLLSVAVALAK